jgi:holin-like protein
MADFVMEFRRCRNSTLSAVGRQAAGMPDRARRAAGESLKAFPWMPLGSLLSANGGEADFVIEKSAAFRYPLFMRIIQQLGLILAFGFAGEIIGALFPVGLPASVLGLVIMLVCLGVKLLRPEHLGETADFLSANMAFFFLPAVASVLNGYDAIKGVVPLLLGICIVCTFFTFALTYGTVRLFQIIMKKGGRQ